MAQITRFRPEDQRKTYNLIPDYYDQQGIKRLNNNQRTFDIETYQERTKDYDSQFTNDYFQVLSRDDNFVDLGSKWYDMDGRGQTVGVQTGTNADGTPVYQTGQALKSDKYFYRKFSERYMNYRKDQTMVMPFSPEETGLVTGVDIDHTNSHDERVRQALAQSNHTQFMMQKQRQAPGETVVDVDTNNNPWMSRGYTGLGSDSGLSAASGNQPISKYQRDLERQKAAYRTLRVVDGDIPETHVSWSPAVVAQQPFTMPLGFIDVEHGETNPDKDDAKKVTRSMFTPMRDQIPDRHQQLIDNYVINTPMVANYFPRNPIDAAAHLASMASTESDHRWSDNTRSYTPTMMRNLMDYLDTNHEVVSDIDALDSLIQKGPTMQDIATSNKGLRDLSNDTTKYDSSLISSNVDMTIGNFVNRHGNGVSDSNGYSEALVSGLSPKDIQDFKAMGRDFVQSMHKTSEMRSKPLNVAGMSDGLPKADTATDIHSLDTRQVANIRGLVLRNPGDGTTMNDFDYDHRMLDNRMTAEMIQRPFEDFLAFERDTQEKPSYKDRERFARGAVYGAAAGSVTKNFFDNVSVVA